MKVNRDILEFSFANGALATLRATNMEQYLRFEVLSVDAPDVVESILWGPIKTTISETIGEFVGVVRNKDFAIGIQSLNVKTTGGELVNDEGGVFGVRGSAAVAREYGSSLQAFCVDRSKPKLIKVWNQFERTEVMASPDFNLVGSAIALFGTSPYNVLDLIGHIEVEEGLPHIMIEGEWAKASPKAARPYIISSFGEETVDQMLDFTEKVGFYSLYHSHPFSNWGHFDLIPSLFPNGREGLKTCVDKAKERGILMGVHTLTTFITTNDAYVTPVPHKDLAIFSPTVLTSDISETATEIFIEDPAFYNKKTVLQTVRIGDELIRFARVSEGSPYKLEDCVRGTFGTSAVVHKKGDKIARMIDHGYKTFYPNINLQNEIVDNLIDLFNETGVAHLDFDGHEGAYASGYGDASKDYFALRLIEGVDHLVVNGTSQSSHYYWHINTYMNWGEPWYGGMKESQNEIRFNNQAVHERNFQPNYSVWEFENTTGKQLLYFKLGADGTKGSIENITIELDSYQTIEIPVQLSAGTSIIYNGSNQLLIYDEKGSMKDKMPVEFGGITIGNGSHTMNVSSEFSSDCDCTLKGMIKLKGKVNVIKSGESTVFIEYMLNIIEDSVEEILDFNNRTLTTSDRLEYFLTLNIKEF